MWYSVGMSDGEDYNEFSCWDSGGAAVLLAVVPAVMYYVFGGHHWKGALMMVGVAGVVGVFVLAVARYTSSRAVSRVMQLVGTLLCILYWVYAVHLLCTWDRFAEPEEPAEAVEAVQG